MSKTYRRTQKGRKTDWLPGIDRWDLYGGIRRYGRYTYYPDKKAQEWIKKNPHRIKDVDDYFHWMTEPSWWHREFHTKPCRAKERMLLHKVKKDAIDVDDTVWPTNKKPHKWYW